MMVRPRTFLLIGILLPILGCGMGGKGIVRGKVVYNGQPIGASDLVITWIGPDHLPSSAPVDAAGNYQLTDIQSGVNKVIVFYRHRPKKNQDAGKEGPSRKADPIQAFQLPEQYSDAEKSTLSYTVEGNVVNTYDIVMTGPPLPGKDEEPDRDK